MSGVFRSERMSLCQLIVQTESAYACICELGELGVVQFTDLNTDVSAFQRKFVSEVRRCDEMERKLRYLTSEIKKESIAILPAEDISETLQPRQIIDLEAILEKLEEELKDINSSTEEMKQNQLECTELLQILLRTSSFFDEVYSSETATFQNDETARLLGAHQQSLCTESGISFVAGVITRERMPGFERMLWRISRGNVYLRHAPIHEPLQDPATDGQVYKTVFVVLFRGQQLKTRVLKICQGFRASLYQCPETAQERRDLKLAVLTRIEDVNAVLARAQDHRLRVLVAAAKNVRSWLQKVRKIKAIYHTMNLLYLDVTQRYLVAECWIPTVEMEAVQRALSRGAELSGSHVTPVLNTLPSGTSTASPPTYHRTNRLTAAFQTLIDSYGVASYRELNPAPFTLITFPFLFAVMFGDMGHGLILTLFAGWMVCKEKPLAARRTKNEIAVIFFGGRYIILMMGLFSIYTGFIYNDVFSKSVDVFGSAWRSCLPAAGVLQAGSLAEDSRMLPPENASCYRGTPYPVGVDPVWQAADNRVIYLNSFKMKLSLLLGVGQMVFGVILSWFNYRYFGTWREVPTVFVPQLLFLCSLFGWLCALCLLKWVEYGADRPGRYSPHCAPSLLLVFINMLLLKDNNAPLAAAAAGAAQTGQCDGYMFDGQRRVQHGLLAVALCCVPWLLLAKPLLAYRDRRRQRRGGQRGGDYQQLAGDDALEDGESEQEEKSEDFSELCIHQAIRTVEFVLGCVSHTASYLRLWALSLAHTQLSEVLWRMVLMSGGGHQSRDFTGALALYLKFAVWALLTVVILVVMEGLSAFLHTLRLHWIEFQSKFYRGEGEPFQPYSFQTALDQPDPNE